jgi:hypothetical protein
MDKKRRLRFRSRPDEIIDRFPGSELQPQARLDLPA